MWPGLTHAVAVLPFEQVTAEFAAVEAKAMGRSATATVWSLLADEQDTEPELDLDGEDDEDNL